MNAELCTNLLTLASDPGSVRHPELRFALAAEPSAAPRLAAARPFGRYSLLEGDPPRAERRRFMDEGNVTTTVIKNGGYTAEMKGDYFTIKSRGITIGHLDLEEGMWVARGQAINSEAPAEAASYAGAGASSSGLPVPGGLFDGGVALSIVERLHSQIAAVLPNGTGTAPASTRDLGLEAAVSVGPASAVPMADALFCLWRCTL